MASTGQNTRMEVAGLFHFLSSMAQLPGMIADDVFSFFEKRKELQRSGKWYATKDHDALNAI